MRVGHSETLWTSVKARAMCTRSLAEQQRRRKQFALAVWLRSFGLIKSPSYARREPPVACNRHFLATFQALFERCFSRSERRIISSLRKRAVLLTKRVVRDNERSSLSPCRSGTPTRLYIQRKTAERIRFLRGCEVYRVTRLFFLYPPRRRSSLRCERRVTHSSSLRVAGVISQPPG